MYIEEIRDDPRNRTEYNKTVHTIVLGITAKVQGRKIVVCEFEIQLHYCIEFRMNKFENGMNPLSCSAMV